MLCFFFSLFSFLTIGGTPKTYQERGGKSRLLGHQTKAGAEAVCGAAGPPRHSVLPEGPGDNALDCLLSFYFKNNFFGG